MERQEYIPRLVDRELETLLGMVGGVVIEGPRACGKTETARRMARSEVLLDVDENARQALAIDPKLLLQGDVPRLFDEWQIEPALWNHVRREIDNRKQPGQFILTGSAVPSDDATRHTGSGRMARLRMRPLSSFESGDSSGLVSLQEWMASGSFSSTDTPGDLETLVAGLVRGGWPLLVRQPPGRATRLLRAYLEEVARTDIQRADGSRHDSRLVARFLHAIGRNVATTASLKTLAADTGGAEGALHPGTVSAYLSALRRIMLIEDQPAWNPELRSRSRLRHSAKLHFVCPSLAAAAVGADAKRLLGDLSYTGTLFESLAVRDLRIYSQLFDAHVLHYRDNTDLEVDAVVEMPDGAWAALEIKLGARWIDDAARNLLTFKGRVKHTENARLGVIIPYGYSYVRPDGVAVIALNALSP